MEINNILTQKIIDSASEKEIVENDISLEPEKFNKIDEELFKIPSNWIWTTIGDITTYKNGFAFNSSMMSKNDKGIPVIKSANIGKKIVKIDSKTDYVEDITDRMKNCLINKNDILMVLSSQSSNVEPLGVSAIYDMDEPALLNQRVLDLKVKDRINPNYLLYIINSNWFHKKLSSKAAGLAQANLKLSHVLTMEVPLPPLEIQNKIVNRINNMLALVNKKIINDKNIIKYKKALKQKIYDLAISNELIENDDTLSQVKIISTAKSHPYEIPNNWKWCTFNDITTKISDGTHSTPKYVEDGIPFLSVKDMSNGTISFNNCKYITKEEHKILYSRCDPKKNDLLITKVGTTGVPVIVDTDKEFSIFVSVAQLRFDDNIIYNKYVKYATLSKVIQNQIKENTKGAVNKNWVIKDIKKTIIPIPPLQQQKKIVNKIEQILKLLEEL